jgi:hypothetical protein
LPHVDEWVADHENVRGAAQLLGDAGLLGAGHEMVDQDSEATSRPGLELGHCGHEVVDAAEVLDSNALDAQVVAPDLLDELGIVVEPMGGIDDLVERVREFEPGPQRRLAVLVDHLVPGSKETRIADDVRRSPVGEHVLVVGHPFVDVWAGVKPERLGLRAWPEVPRDVEWKHGVCEALGWPHADQADIARAWQQILGRVTSYADCEPALLGRVEELIDFVTQTG